MHSSAGTLLPCDRGETRMNRFSLFVSALLLATPAWTADAGPFSVISQNESIVSDVRTDAENVWIKLVPAYADATITVRISNQNGDDYRMWFHDQLDLVSTGSRGRNAWSDRVQTQANYIEYWLNDELVLHLKRQTASSD